MALVADLDGDSLVGIAGIESGAVEERSSGRIPVECPSRNGGRVSECLSSRRCTAGEAGPHGGMHEVESRRNAGHDRQAVRRVAWRDCRMPIEWTRISHGGRRLADPAASSCFERGSEALAPHASRQPRARRLRARRLRIPRLSRAAFLALASSPQRHLVIAATSQKGTAKKLRGPSARAEERHVNQGCQPQGEPGGPKLVRRSNFQLFFRSALAYWKKRFILWLSVS